MLLYIVFGVVALLIVGVVVMLKLGGTVTADVIVAIQQGQYQFIALMEPDGTMTYPKVDGIPNWYLETTGFSINQTTAETKEKDLAYMREYNETMLKELKAQEKFHLIEKEIATVGKNLGHL